MQEKKEWQQFSLVLKELFNLEYSPVSVTLVKTPLSGDAKKKTRICKAILDAGKGETFQIGKANNACFGASWHLGFEKISDPRVMSMIKKFVVEGEKLFCSYAALDKLIAQMEDVPDHAHAYFLLSPLETARVKPDLVIFICNAEAACRILTFVTFSDGVMPKIKIGGPTCRLGVIYPLLKQEVNLSFYDYTARKICNVDKDKMIISVPYQKIPLFIDSIDKCSAGKAKIEYPQEFREFLQKKLATGNK